MNSRPTARAQVHRHPMRVVTRRTGLSAELLRVWERRYRVVTPARTQTGRRLYSDSEIERLRLLYRATLGGRSISSVASLATPALVALLKQDAEAELARPAEAIAPRRAGEPEGPALTFLEESLRAVDRFDPLALSAVLRRSSVALPATMFLEQVVASVLEQVDGRCHDGSLRPVHGYLTASVVRHVLERITVSAPPPAPGLLLATVTGQMHELGALMAAAAASAEGWSVTWLGTNLPADDIAEAAKKLKVRAVGLSLVYPTGQAAVAEELRRLRSLLPRSITLIVGGAATSGYAGVIDEIGAVRIEHLDALVTMLRDLASRLRSRRRARVAKA